MSHSSRRDFLRSSAGAAGLLATAALDAPAAPLFDTEPTAKKIDGKSDTLRVAVVGVHGRGMSHVEGFANKHNCVVTTICDCDEGVIGKAMTAV